MAHGFGGFEYESKIFNELTNPKPATLNSIILNEIKKPVVEIPNFRTAVVHIHAHATYAYSINNIDSLCKNSILYSGILLEESFKIKKGNGAFYDKIKFIDNLVYLALLSCKIGGFIDQTQFDLILSYDSKQIADLFGKSGKISKISADGESS